MRRLLLTLSRKFFSWPPTPISDIRKREVIGAAGKRFDVSNLLETGTFRGDMVEAQRQQYARIVTIELAPDLARAAQARFESAPHITVIEGDSAEKISEAIGIMDGPILFWLDGHFSGGSTAGDDEACPIMKELACIANRRQGRDVVMIDDARLFGWRKGYPAISSMRRFASSRFPQHEFKVEEDMIQILPKQER